MSYPIRPKNLKKIGVDNDNVAALRDLQRKVTTLTEGQPNQAGVGSLTWSDALGTFTITKPGGTVVPVGTVSSVAASGGTTGLTFSGTPITTSGTLTLGGTLGFINGGTGLTATPANGQLLIGNSAGYTLSTLTAGTAISISNASGSITITNTLPDQTVVLTGAGTTVVTGTYPNFTITSNDQYTGTVTSVAASGGTTGLTFSGSPITTSGTLTLGGTLAVANGGTGATTLASGYLLKGNGTSAVTASVAYDDGTNIGIGTTSPSALLTISRHGGGDIGALVSQTNSGNGTSGRYRATHGSGAAVNLEAGNNYTAVKTTSSSPLIFYTNNTEHFRVGSAGQWGIGGANYGTAGQVFTSGGASAAPTWTTPTTGTVTSVNLTAGTGISVSGGPITTSGSINVVNTAPDQIVSLTGAGTTSITGTYPNFTITSNDAYVGTVTSVSGTGSVNGITLTGTVTSSGSLTLGGTLGGIANSQLTNSSITINGSAISLGGSVSVGTVTSVGGTGTVNGITLTGTVTSSGNLTLGGTLSGVSLTTQVSGTLPVTSGGTGVTTSTGSGSTVLSSQPSFGSTIGVGGVSASASGAGISFPASQSASTDPNTLDDYEEGSCTITIQDSAGNSATMGGSNVFRYVKIGAFVQVSGTLNWTSIASLSGGSRIQFHGLPFIVNTVGNYRAPALFGSSAPGSFNITRAEIAGGADNGNTFIFGTKVSGNNVDGAMVPADLGSSGTMYGFQINYTTSF